ncbi:MAG: diacylglycerol kinase family protein [Deltaproteobacteria bacterium]|nr:diacylglycerol kinase family protein [Deltaproteobacteria bacterium]
MIGVVVNPFSRRNRGQTDVKRRIERIVGDHGRVVETYSTDAIIPALRQFADEGRKYWVADGGDGALHWMINGAARYFGPEQATKIARYVPTGGGSVDFVAQGLGLARDPRTVLSQLVKTLEKGGEPKRVPLRTMELNGTQVLYGDIPTAFRRYAFATAFAGYGANFFGPLHEGSGEKSPARIAKLMATGFGAAAGRALLTGGLARFKPRVLAKAEESFLRAIHARVRIDGELHRDREGKVLTEHTVLQCAALPLKLAGILHVFPLANNEQLHVHAGRVSGVEAARVWPLLMTGKRVQHLLPDAYDGPARELQVQCEPGNEMHPVLDGEVFFRLTELTATLGPTFEMAVPM